MLKRRINFLIVLFALTCSLQLEAASIELTVQAISKDPTPGGPGEESQTISVTGEVWADAIAFTSVGTYYLNYPYSALAKMGANAAILSPTQGNILCLGWTTGSYSRRHVDGPPAEGHFNATVNLDVPPSVIRVVGIAKNGWNNGWSVNAGVNGNARISATQSVFGGHTEPFWSHNSYTGVVWSWNGEPLPGAEGGPPLPPAAVSRVELREDDDPVQVPQEVSGSFLVNPGEFLAPITADYGSEDPIYFTTQQPSAPAARLTADSVSAASHAAVDVRGYYFTVAEDAPYFTSFHLPELPPDQTYRLWTPDVFLEVTGSEVVDFTTLFPEGVSRFYVLGMGENAPDVFPHIFGVTFAEEGAANFYVAAVAVPEPSAVIQLFAVAVCGIAARRFQQGRAESKI